MTSCALLTGVQTGNTILRSHIALLAAYKYILEPKILSK